MRILCLTAGGTIAAERDAAGAVVTARPGADVVGAADADVEVLEVARESSTVLGLGQVFAWARLLSERLREPGLAGAVVTTGTETLPEVAYGLGLAVGGTKPVVVTGAMRPADDPAADGPANLAAALAVARDGRAHGAGALVVLAGEVHDAARVVKRHASADDAFASPGGPLGTVTPDGTLELRGPPPPREHVAAPRIEERVALVRAVLGGGTWEVDGAVAGGARGLVLHTFPAGGVPPATAAAVVRALDAGVAVVAASPAAGGPVTTYAGPGEGRWLAERGVRLARDLEPARARVRLALALGLDDPAALATVFP
jgi:L-asparaginase